MQTVAPSTDEGKVVYLPTPLFDNDLLNEAIDEGVRQPTILVVVRLVPQKNHELLPRAFAALPSALHHGGLAVVGDGLLRNHLEQIACQLKVNERGERHTVAGGDGEGW